MLLIKNKFHVAGATMFALLLCLFACEKKQEIQPKSVSIKGQADISVKNGRLVFKNRTVFESTTFLLEMIIN